VYEDYSYWDKAKKQNRHRRIYIGKLDMNREFIPNKLYLKRQSHTAEEGDAASPEAKTVSRIYFGATHLLDWISKDTGIASDLKAAFPKSYRQMLSLAYYLVLESDSPMYRFPRWGHDHTHPWGGILTSQAISEIMRDVDERGKMEFFRRQSRRRQEKEYLAYDTTSVSSWSEYIKGVRYGKNKDGDSLPQVNMALVFGETSGMPVYYRELPGNISDMSTIRKLLKDVSFLEIKKLKLVLDRGFFSAKNINALYKGHYKFLISGKASVKKIQAAITTAKANIKRFENYDLAHDVYCCSTSEKWPYEKTDKNGNTIEEERRLYVHVYYNGQRGEDEKARFNRALALTESAIRSGAELTEAQQSKKQKYFIVKETPKRGLHIEYNEDAILKHMDDIGYFVLMSNEIKGPEDALEVYRRKDMVEKAFDNLKERLEMRRTQAHSDEILTGRFFLQFLALIFVSYVHKRMSKSDLYKNYTMQSLFDNLDVIEQYEFGGQRYHYSEITDKQRELYRCFGAEAPNTL
jgi:transposase